MSGDQSGTEIEVYEAPRFTKALSKLDDTQLVIVEDEIEKIVADPEIGERKRGDLSYLWVHKFYLEGHQLLLGYNWNGGELILHLLTLGPHENFYRDQKKRRKADLKMINS